MFKVIKNSGIFDNIVTFQKFGPYMPTGNKAVSNILIQIKIILLSFAKVSLSVEYA